MLWVVQPDLNLYEGPVRPHISDKAWGAATTHTPPPATLRFEEASRDAHATYFERTPPSRSAAQPAWVADDRKPASVPFGDAWAALPAPAFQEGGAPIHLEADGSTRAAGMDSNKYRITQGFTATGLKMDKDCWGRPFGH